MISTQHSEDLKKNITLLYLHGDFQELSQLLEELRDTVWLCKEEEKEPLIGALPLLCDMLGSASDEGIRSLACACIQNFSLHQKGCEMIFASNGVDILAPIARGETLPGSTLCATIAIANVVACIDKDKLDTKLLLINDSVAQSMVDCLDATVRDAEYPPNSGLFWMLWEIGQGFANLSRVPAFSKVLAENGGVSVLCRALEKRMAWEKKQKSSKGFYDILMDDGGHNVTQLLLEALWNLESVPQ